MTEDTKLVLEQLAKTNRRLDLITDVLRQIVNVLPPHSNCVVLDGPYTESFEADIRRIHALLDDCFESHEGGEGPNR